MSTLRVNTIQNASGGSAIDVPGAAKAWVNFNGTGTVAIRAQLNVSSITDNGVGDYTVNFATAFADTNYSAVTGVKDESTAAPAISFTTTGGIYSTTQVRLKAWTYTGTAHDTSIVNLAAFR